jgi:hypothetical protein
MKTADSLKYSKPTTNQMVFVFLNDFLLQTQKQRVFLLMISFVKNWNQRLIIKPKNHPTLVI